MAKLLSKEAIKGLLLREFKDDKRITDELLFDGNKMTMECYVLLKSLFPKRGYYEGNILDDLGYHCYISFEYDSGKAKKNYNQFMKELTSEKLKEIYRRLDSIVGENGCYMISDCISGQRDDGQNVSNRYTHYSSGTETLCIDIWLFSINASFLDFADNNSGKCDLLFETNM